ncbi:Uncharacterized protein FWK35_00011849, partial [Aphis craccivora]
KTRDRNWFLKNRLKPIGNAVFSLLNTGIGTDTKSFKTPVKKP